jgi:hypothetical protein
MPYLLDSSKYVMTCARKFLQNNEAPRQFRETIKSQDKKGTKQRGCMTISLYIEVY